MAQHEVSSVLRRLKNGTEAYQEARRLIQRERWADAEGALRLAATQSVGALEWALKAHLRHPKRAEAMDPGDYQLLRQPTFEVLIRLLRRYGDPVPDAEIVDSLFSYRDLRNQAEHGGLTPSMEALSIALSDIKEYIPVLLGLPEASPTHETGPSGSIPPLPLPERPQHVAGRGSQLDRATALLAEAARSAKGKVILLAGESGAGKTILCHELLHRAAELGFDVAATACEPFQGGTTLFPVREILRQLSGQANAANAVRTLYPAASAQVATAELAEDPTVEPHERRDAYMASFSNVLYGRFRAGAGARPILMFFDDLEWVEASTVDAILCAKARFGDGPVVVLGAYRTDVVAGFRQQHPLVPLITLSARHPDQVDLVQVGGLGRDVFEVAISSILGGPIDLPAGMITRLFQETEGNPLFLREILRSVAKEGGPETCIGRDANGVWRSTRPISAWTMPATIEEAIEARLRHLTEPQREELERAAVVGRNFAYSILVELSERAEDELADNIDDLLEFDVIREIDTGADISFEFTHGKIRDVIYSAIPRFRRLRMHKQVADILINVDNALDSHRFDGTIGTHLFIASDLARAKDYLLAGARGAAHSFMTTQALELYERALESYAQTGFSAETPEESLRLEFAQSLRQAGLYHRAIDVLPTELKSDGHTRAEILDCLGDLYWLVGDHARAHTYYLACQALAEAEGYDDLRLEVAADLCEFHDREAERLAGVDAEKARDHRERSSHYLKEQIRLASVSTDGKARSRAARNKAKQLRRDGDVGAALVAYEEALGHADVRQPDHSVLISYAKTLRFAGRVEEAQRIVQTVLDWGCQTGSVRTEAIARQYLGLLKLEQPDPDTRRDALTDILAAAGLHEELGYGRGLRETLLLLGEYHLHQEQPEAARQAFARALNLADANDEQVLRRTVADQLIAADEHARAAFVLNYGDGSEA